MKAGIDRLGAVCVASLNDSQDWEDWEDLGNPKAKVELLSLPHYHGGYKDDLWPFLFD